ncbi:MAG: hypothetical protein M5R42_06525 [Rhodocyclaceae bacterium]|nr:hypothetical protein [Rhodocyclaceae bacterium]
MRWRMRPPPRAWQGAMLAGSVRTGRCRNRLQAKPPPALPPPGRARHRRSGARSQVACRPAGGREGHSRRPMVRAGDARAAANSLQAQGRRAVPHRAEYRTAADGHPPEAGAAPPAKPASASAPAAPLQIREDDDSWNLSFAIDRCVGCGVCLEVRQPRVLYAAETFDASPEREPAILRQLAKQRCNRCDRHFVSTEPCETCPVCADDADAFAAIFG